MRVLVVDDEPLARAALTELLSQRSDVEKFDVAEDAHEALATLRAHPYDVLLLDIHMPDLSGFSSSSGSASRTGRCRRSSSSRPTRSTQSRRSKSAPWTTF